MHLLQKFILFLQFVQLVDLYVFIFCETVAAPFRPICFIISTAFDKQACTFMDIRFSILVSVFQSVSLLLLPVEGFRILSLLDVDGVEQSIRMQFFGVCSVILTHAVIGLCWIL